MPSAQASGWVALCCLVIAGFGFLVTHTSSSSSSSAPYSAAAAPVAPAASSAAGAGESHAAAGSAPNNSDQQSEPSASASSSAPTDVLFIETGTRYQRSTLASQVQNAIQAGVIYSGLAPGSTQSAAASSSSMASASSSGARPLKASPSLQGCVWQLTGGVTPSLVDRASYDGKPAYIIAVPSQVWVVGLGCTAAHTDVIARVALKG
jgi:hypothetical protein